VADEDVLLEGADVEDVDMLGSPVDIRYASSGVA
jgi:hypothetical protein